MKVLVNSKRLLHAACIGIILLASAPVWKPALSKSIESSYAILCFSTISGVCNEEALTYSCGQQSCIQGTGGLWTCQTFNEQQVFPNHDGTLNTAYWYEIEANTVHACYPTDGGSSQSEIDDVDPTACMTIYDCYCDPNSGAVPCKKGNMVANSIQEFIDCSLGETGNGCPQIFNP